MRASLLAHCAALAALGALAMPLAPSVADELSVRIGYVAPAEPAPLPLSLIEPVADDHGLMGARLAIGDKRRRLCHPRFPPAAGAPQLEDEQRGARRRSRWLGCNGRFTRKSLSF